MGTPFLLIGKFFLSLYKHRCYENSTIPGANYYMQY